MVRKIASTLADNVDLIRASLKSLANKSHADHALKYFKTGKGQYGEGDKFMGIRVPKIRSLERNYKSNLSLEECTLLLTSPWHEERLFAVINLGNRFEQSTTIEQQHIYQLYMKHAAKHVNNWDLVDVSAPKIVGAYWWERRKGENCLQSLSVMARSPSLWERRISIMSTFYFIRQREYDITLALANILVDDKEDLIHKAVGWMLREVGTRDQAKAEQFLRLHYQTMPRTMLRYAIEKYTQPLRSAYLSGVLPEQSFTTTNQNDPPLPELP